MKQKSARKMKTILDKDQECCYIVLCPWETCRNSRGRLFDIVNQGSGTGAEISFNPGQTAVARSLVLWQ
jgi:hypothetical protein